ncbi:unnamed protein product [Moneuplotes crassus]|uniref:Uncharacterized protein n=1 Tax=Euplotes crassus TaxID=5936 RepID=A0AAD1XEA3_EUPCR|nr:unnamed protein product [Moneuplotes crassus]
MCISECLNSFRVVLGSSMKPFREFFAQLSKKVKQKSLKDAIKMADNKDKARQEDPNLKDYKSETDSIIESLGSGEEEQSEEEISVKKNFLAKSKKQESKEESKEESILEDPPIEENKSDDKMDEDSEDKKEVEKEENKDEDSDYKADNPSDIISGKSSEKEKKSTPKRVTRKRLRREIKDLESPEVKTTPKKKRGPYKKKDASPKRSLRERRSKKVLSDNEFHLSEKINKSSSKTTPKKSHLQSNRERTSKATQELQKLALIRTKLDNVLKEKFTSIDLVAEENSDKIFEDFEFLSRKEIDVKSLCMTGICKSLHKFQRYCKQKYKRYKEKKQDPSYSLLSTEKKAQDAQCLKILQKIVDHSKKILHKFRDLVNEYFFDYTVGFDESGFK